MRYLLLGFCVLTTAYTATTPGTPTAPSSAITAPSSTDPVASTLHAGGSALPFSGTLQATETAGALNRLTGAGEATHLGRFTLISEFTVVPPPVSTASGTARWTAANCDQIATTVTDTPSSRSPSRRSPKPTPSQEEPADLREPPAASSSSVL